MSNFDKTIKYLQFSESKKLPDKLFKQVSSDERKRLKEKTGRAYIDYAFQLAKNYHYTLPKDFGKGSGKDSGKKEKPVKEKDKSVDLKDFIDTSDRVNEQLISARTKEIESKKKLDDYIKTIPEKDRDTDVVIKDLKKQYDLDFEKYATFQDLKDRAEGNLQKAADLKLNKLQNQVGLDSAKVNEERARVSRNISEYETDTRKAESINAKLKADNDYQTNKRAYGVIGAKIIKHRETIQGLAGIGRDELEAQQLEQQKVEQDRLSRLQGLTSGTPVDQARIQQVKESIKTEPKTKKEIRKETNYHPDKQSGIEYLKDNAQNISAGVRDVTSTFDKAIFGATPTSKKAARLGKSVDRLRKKTEYQSAKKLVNATDKLPFLPIENQISDNKFQVKKEQQISDAISGKLDTKASKNLDKKEAKLGNRIEDDRNQMRFNKISSAVDNVGTVGGTIKDAVSEKSMARTVEKSGVEKIKQRSAKLAYMFGDRSLGTRAALNRGLNPLEKVLTGNVFGSKLQRKIKSNEKRYFRGYSESDIPVTLENSDQVADREKNKINVMKALLNWDIESIDKKILEQQNFSVKNFSVPIKLQQERERESLKESKTENGEVKLNPDSVEKILNASFYGLSDEEKEFQESLCKGFNEVDPKETFMSQFSIPGFDNL